MWLQLMLEASPPKSYNSGHAFKHFHYEGPRDFALILDSCGSIRHWLHAARGQQGSLTKADAARVDAGYGLLQSRQNSFRAE
jgi:hypothetical protein